MKTNLAKAMRNWIFLLFIVSIVSCKEDKEVTASYDPTSPVEVTSFSPQKGGGGIQFLVYGSNFGTDASQIEVTVKGHKALVISSDGSCIYCMVPYKAESGPVKVKVGGREQIQEVVSKDEFSYIPTPVVKTLCGWTDRDNNSSITDGDFVVAQFEQPFWLEMDNSSDLYLVEDRRGLRKISLAEKKVTTLFRSGGGMDQIRAIGFSPDHERLYLWNDQESSNGVGIGVAHRKSGFKLWETLVQAPNCCGGDVHPLTDDLFFNRWHGGEYYKWNRETKEKEHLFRVENQFNSSLLFSPDGTFGYILSISHHCIYKVDFNSVTGKISGLRTLCGKKGSKGYSDGPGTRARFNQLKQGVFDENNNFYVCDADNQCIRKVEPNGQVTTFAGRPGEWGYIDGDLRKEARFNYPCGIAYDQSSGIFYVADTNNKRIRIITKE